MKRCVKHLNSDLNSMVNKYAPVSIEDPMAW
jgi:hypothetical protein